MHSKSHVAGRGDLQLVPDVLGLELLDPLDEVALLEAAVAALVPVGEDLPEVADLQLLQVDVLQVDLLVCKAESTK